MKLRYTLPLILACTLYSVHAVYSQPFLDFEGGMVYTSYNNVRIPDDDGTKFNFTDDLNTSPSFFFRLRTGLTFFERHTISFLYAPLLFVANGTPPENIIFQDKTFVSTEQIHARFQLDSYRLTYRYDFINSDVLMLGIGLSANIWNISLRLDNKIERSKKLYTGFVPLINFRLQWVFFSPFSLLFEWDAFWTNQVRAEDLLLALQVHFGNHLTLRAGYRLFESGINNDEVYISNLFHYWLAGFTYTF